MWDEFYYVLVTDESGKTTRKWKDQHERPTVGQFRYYGPIDDPKQQAWRKQQPSLSHLERNYRALPGTAKDGVHKVGLRASIDSTSPDIEFVSLLSRLKRIGPAYRILICDIETGYIAGFYQGVHPPSAATVNLAFLHALSRKRKWLESIHLEKECPEEDWIPMMFAQAIADNTDLRCEEVKNSLASIGTTLLYVPTRRSDRNPVSESGHHIVHRMGDHAMVGTTFGRQRERGEESADLRARLTMTEGEREAARAIHVHNTMVLKECKRHPSTAFFES